MEVDEMALNLLVYGHLAWTCYLFIHGAFSNTNI